MVDQCTDRHRVNLTQSDNSTVTSALTVTYVNNRSKGHSVSQIFIIRINNNNLKNMISFITFLLCEDNYVETSLIRPVFSASKPADHQLPSQNTTNQDTTLSHLEFYRVTYKILDY